MCFDIGNGVAKVIFLFIEELFTDPVSLMNGCSVWNALLVGLDPRLRGDDEKGWDFTG